jgi:hypothetical protein
MSTTPQPGDSPLVLAAKRTLAARRQTTTRAAIRVTDNNMRRSARVSFATGPVEGPATSAGYPSREGATSAATQPPDPAAQAAAKIEQLKNEQTRMREESDQGPYGELDEGYVEGRLSQIPKEIESTEKAGQPPPPQDQD